MTSGSERRGRNKQKEKEHRKLYKISAYTTKKKICWRRQLKLCAWCAEPLFYASSVLTRIKPRRDGGSDELENLEAMHEYCNGIRNEDLCKEHGVNQSTLPTEPAHER